MTIKPELLEYDLGCGAMAFSTTRRGGCSVGAYAAFNINHYCGDDEAAVMRNREALCQTLGISSDRLVMPHQVHQTKTLKIDPTFMTLPTEEQKQLLEGVDAVMTSLDSVCIGVSTADCIPLLLYDAEHHAACAVHAGWRGTVARITEKAVRAMTETYGTHPESLKAVIGPGISLDSFEVGDEVYDAFEKEGFMMDFISKRYPINDSGSRSSLLACSEGLKKLFTFNSSLLPHKWHLDLPECNHLQLISTGVMESNIALSHICTYQQCDTFFSARRLGIHSGRIFTGIMLKR